MGSWGLVGLEFSGSILWSLPKCGGPLVRVLHEKEKRSRGSLTRTQFFILVLICSAAYCFLPTYLFTVLASISWIALRSVLANQLGSGQSGLGIGSFGLDWTAITSYLGTPLASPWFATANIAVGFVLFVYVIIPIFYWSDIYLAKNFPIYSKNLFTSNGSRYDIISIIDSKFELDKAVYAQTGSINLSTMFTMTYGLGFDTLSATIVHVALFNGRDLWRPAEGTFGGNKKEDIHTKVMRAYKPVPTWF